MSLTILLLPSPLLPALAYDGLAAALSAAGVRTSIAPSDLAADEHADDLVRRWTAWVTAGAVLVPHSNAGYLAPVARAAAGGAQPIVFMDAALPPARGSTPLAPPKFRAHLAGLADEDGRLPPWTRWWPRAALEDVVPARGFEALDQACPRLPLSYFDTSVTSPPSWADAGDAYLAFGTTYAEELRFAKAHGWPHSRLAGSHLHFMHDPAAVAAQIVALAADLSG
jgi:hypothetical protein